MSVKRATMTLLAVCLLSGTARAQEDTTHAAGLTVRSTPSGASVVLKGDVTLVGITPTHFEQRLAGDYKVVARRHLYERRTVHVTLSPDKASALDIALSPKTRFKAVLRSAFIPGYGQWYSEQPTKGILFNIAALGAVTGSLIANKDYQDKYDTYKQARQNYDVARRLGAPNDELKILYDRYQSAQSDATSAQDTRRVVYGITAGVWALNILDALFFFPREEPPTTLGLSVEPITAQQQLGFVITRKF